MVMLTVLGEYNNNCIMTVDDERIPCLPWSREAKDLKGKFGFFQLEELQLYLQPKPDLVIKNFILVEDKDGWQISLLIFSRGIFRGENLEQESELCSKMCRFSP